LNALPRELTLEKMLAYAERAAEEACELAVFGEAMLPGYPFWIERTDDARLEINRTRQSTIDITEDI
jgi:nitrilase